MSDQLLARVQSLKLDALALRNREKFTDAIAKLDEAIDELDRLADALRGDAPQLARVRSELADTWGARGGVQRRAPDMAAALRDYKKGLDAERLDPERKSSYNLGNVISLKILGGQSIEDPDLKAEIDEAIRSLRTHSAGTQGDLAQAKWDGARADDWWAAADLGQFLLLRGDFGQARLAYEHGLENAPKQSDIERHLYVLRDLLSKVEPTPGPRADVLRWLADEAA